jgi:ABC-type methionine transport system permease subunit
MIMTYAVFLLILAIGVIVGIYLGYTKKDDFIKETQNAYTILFNARNEQLTSKALDNVQKAVSFRYFFFKFRIPN